MLDRYQASAALPDGFDARSLLHEGTQAIFHGADENATYLGAMWGAFVKIPQGHQAIALNEGCGAILPFEGRSHLGACVVASNDGYLVTVAKPGNPLGLSAGDKVVAVDGLVGESLYQALVRRPMCGNSAPSEAYRRAITAASFFDLLSPSEQLRVIAPDGKERTVVVGSKTSRVISCRDPFDRSAAVYAEAIQLPDGTAVIRIPQFFPFDAPPTLNASQEDTRVAIAKFQEKIRVVFDTVKHAPRLVWDIRGNSGGMTPVGLAIASGMPGARTGVATYCMQRVGKSSPPQYVNHYADYTLTPGGEFTYSGKVAVLIDGLDYSAADYFPYFVGHATQALLVGSETAGAYGGPGPSFVTKPEPRLTFTFDGNRCVNEAAMPLEGHGVVPHVVVQYTSSDLAQGKDTVLEAAIRALTP